MTFNLKEAEAGAIDGLLKSYAGTPDNFEQLIDGLIRKKVQTSHDLRTLARDYKRPKYDHLATKIQAYETQDRYALHKVIHSAKGYIEGIRKRKEKMTDQEIKQKGNDLVVKAMKGQS